MSWDRARRRLPRHTEETGNMKSLRAIAMDPGASLLVLQGASARRCRSQAFEIRGRGSRSLPCGLRLLAGCAGLLLSVLASPASADTTACRQFAARVFGPPPAGAT